MNHWVPDFDMDEDYSIPTTSSLTRQSGEDEIMELLWQNNSPVAVNPLGECLFPKSPSSSSKSCVTAPPSPLPLDPPPEAASNQLHMAEDEMASWLHYPVEDLYTDLLYPSPISSVPLPPSLARPVPIGARPFSLFSRMRSSASEPLTRLRSGATVVDSSTTPIVAASRLAPSCPSGSLEERSASRGVRETGTEGAVEGGIATTFSSSGSGTSSANATATATTPGDTSMRTISSEVVDRKRKSKEIEESFATTTAVPFDPQNEEVELESGDEKKHGCGSSASKRTRAAEVHNLSERRRRDRINERMKALQELIPRCNKSDKASMLDEAIEYLKSLQMQLQMMSTGCGMVPMMYPGMQQQYMPTMGMGMGMDLGMTRPGMPYAPALPAPPTASLMPPALPTTPTASVMPPPALPTTPTASVMPPLAPRMPTAAFAMPLVAAPHHLLVNQPSNLADSTNSPYPILSPGMGQVPNMVDPYHQYLAYQQMQMQAVQGQTSSHPSSSKPTLSKSEGDNEDDIQ